MMEKVNVAPHCWICGCNSRF